MKMTNLKCVEMVREIRDGLYLETKSMTENELIEFYSQKNKKTENKKKQNNQSCITSA